MVLKIGQRELDSLETSPIPPEELYVRRLRSRVIKRSDLVEVDENAPIQTTSHLVTPESQPSASVQEAQPEVRTEVSEQGIDTYAHEKLKPQPTLKMHPQINHERQVILAGKQHVPVGVLMCSSNNRV